MKRGIILILFVVLTMTTLGTVYAREGDEQYIIGDLILVGDEGFKAEMTDLGYVEGENTTYITLAYNPDLSWEEWMAEYQRQVESMVDAGVDIFITNTDTDAALVKSLAGDIPIVFARSDDPVATGAVQDLVAPGSSITGIITNRPHERRLQILTELNPDTDTVYYMYSTNTLEAEGVLNQVKALGDELGIEIVPAPIADPTSQQAAVENVPEGTDWIFMTPYVYLDAAQTETILASSVELHAGISYFVDMPMPGYVVSYGPNLDDTGRQAAHIIDRILRGASPADLPVQTAENYLTINLEAAEAIGLEIPESTLRQADTIVRPGFFDVPADN
jgi:putative ABC transport system substrate-binding protein